ncbi:ankyrin repeat domain-containing protein [Thiomicrospira cyclica]|uniref:Ankyrin n=1 Tax=Thiomicrospira cyclica (strain DSM 14477 / JCM 11371 / ALM1) TaxID=717773 RepID=F6DAJ7_THICA|nr:hypothetical protein [Thiomicrospira cyclica]AEG32253.1 Ankyrin [Thiomicrospira cyclica ALM1]
MFEKLRLKRSLNRKVEEILYELAYKEFEDGKVRPGLWAKALSESDGSEVNTLGCYLKLRVRSIEDDTLLLSSLVDSVVKGEDFNKIYSDQLNKKKSNNPKIINSIDQYDENGYTQLMNAIMNLDLEKVNILIRQGANLSLTDDNFGFSAIEIANLQLTQSLSMENEIKLRNIIRTLKAAV